VTVNTDPSDNGAVNVALKNYDEDIIIVDFSVLDAEYDINNDVWVAISRNPSQLHVIDASEKTMESVSLQVVPQCVSVRPDGAYAVVGHNAWLTRVNLSTPAAETPVPITTDANDVVLAQNDFAYVFPKGSGSHNLRSVELPGGTETQDQKSIYSGMIARLHPSGNSIYAADNGISPSDVEKFDISTGSAVYEYDSPYHGEYAFSGNLWFSNDGSEFIARTRYVFNASPDSLSDMVYAGALSVNRIVEWAVQSPTNDKWYVSHTNWNDEVSNEVNIYDTFFQFESFLSVPDVPNLTSVGPHPFSAVGARYVAVNTAGTKLHVIGRRVDDNVWAVASIDLTL
jgi:hypothetical protein